jgi:phage tail tape-measure protein
MSSPFALKLPKIPRPILKLLRSPIVVVSAASLGVRIGKDAYKLKHGEIDSKEFRARTGSHLGSVSGGMVGAAAGAAALSVVPGVGTVLGAFAGGLVGETIGSKLGRRSAERFEEAVYGVTVAAAAGEKVASDGASIPPNKKRHI